jgi:hypothetical protein
MMKATLETVAATLSTLQTTFEEQFKEVREQFKHVDEQFKDVHERIRAESEESRRHFEMLVEQMKAERNLVLDGSLANTAELGQLRQSHLADHTLFEQTLADHEERLTQLEKKD